MVGIRIGIDINRLLIYDHRPDGCSMRERFVLEVDQLLVCWRILSLNMICDHRGHLRHLDLWQRQGQDLPMLA